MSLRSLTRRLLAGSTTAETIGRAIKGVVEAVFSAASMWVWILIAAGLIFVLPPIPARVSVGPAELSFYQIPKKVQMVIVAAVITYREYNRGLRCTYPG